MALGPQKEKKLSSEAEMACKAAIKEKFLWLNQHPGEVGSCKKMIPLHLLAPDYRPYAVVMSHGMTAQHKMLIEKERQLLAYMQEHGYPVVSVYGDAFAVETAQEQTRYGMLMDFIDGVFIEAKTVAPLRLQILACLLQIHVVPNESWLAFHGARLIENITTQICEPLYFQQIKAPALALGNQFHALLEKLTVREESIVDLQMIITKDGRLVIIDPLDIVKNQNCKCVIDGFPAMEEARGLRDFLKQTTEWLKHAQLFCQKVVNATHPKELLALINLAPQPLLNQFNQAPPKGASRLHQLKHDTAQSRFKL